LEIRRADARHVRPAGLGTEVEVLVDEVFETEMGGESGRQEEPRVGHLAVVVERHIDRELAKVLADQMTQMLAASAQSQASSSVKH
jgi:hypothetical protein